MRLESSAIVIFDNLRKEKVRLEYSQEQKRLSHDFVNSKISMVDRLIVREAFDMLSPEHQEILVLIDVMGFKYAEAAETLDIAKGTVMSRVSRARSEMLHKLGKSPRHCRLKNAEGIKQ